MPGRLEPFQIRQALGRQDIQIICGVSVGKTAAILNLKVKQNAVRISVKCLHFLGLTEGRCLVLTLMIPPGATYTSDSASANILRRQASLVSDLTSP